MILKIEDEEIADIRSLRQTLASLLEELRRRWRHNTPLYDAFTVPSDSL